MDGLHAIHRLAPPDSPWFGTGDAAHDLVKAVTFALEGVPHRIAYRSALDFLGVLSPPARTVHVAMSGSVGFALLGRRPLRTVLENESDLVIGARRVEQTSVSDLERATLDAASRPDLIGHATALAVTVSVVASQLDLDRLQDYGERLDAGPALRRIGSVAEQLAIQPLAKRMHPAETLDGTVLLDPKGPMKRVWYDERWGVHWNRHLQELQEALARP